MNKFLRVLVGVASILAMAYSVEAVNLSWVAPTNNMDGTALTNLTGYKLYSGKTSGVYSATSDVGLITSTNIDNSTVSGVVYYAISAYDSNGNEGPFSDEIVFNDFIANAPVVSSTTYTVKSGLATISFTAPTKNVDGTSCSGQIRGYIIGYGRVPKSVQAYTNFVYTGLVTKATITIPTNSGTWYSSIATTNQWGNISPYSVESSFGTTAPSKPGNAKADIIDLR